MNFFDGSGAKKSRQDKYLSNENAEMDIKDIKDAINFGDRYGDNSNKGTYSVEDKYKQGGDNLLDEFSVGSLNSIREDTNSNREDLI